MQNFSFISLGTMRINLDGFSSYHHSYLSKQETIQENAKLFNDDCELFDLSQEDVDSNTVQTAWDLVAPSISEDDAVTNKVGFSTLQQHDGEMLLDATHSENNKNSGYLLCDTLSKLYVKAAK